MNEKRAAFEAKLAEFKRSARQDALTHTAESWRRLEDDRAEVLRLYDEAALDAERQGAVAKGDWVCVVGPGFEVYGTRSSCEAVQDMLERDQAALPKDEPRPVPCKTCGGFRRTYCPECDPRPLASDDMVQAGKDWYETESEGDCLLRASDVRGIFSAMLAAAPETADLAGMRAHLTPEDQDAAAVADDAHHFRERSDLAALRKDAEITNMPLYVNRFERKEERRRKFEADEALGWWMSAALEDPKVCAEMKAAVTEWFDATWPPAPQVGETK